MNTARSLLTYQCGSQKLFWDMRCVRNFTEKNGPPTWTSAACFILNFLTLISIFQLLFQKLNLIFSFCFVCLFRTYTDLCRDSKDRLTYLLTGFHNQQWLFAASANYRTQLRATRQKTRNKHQMNSFEICFLATLYCAISLFLKFRGN